MKKILHIISSDKFTVPFVNFINKEFDLDEHLFLFDKKPEENLLMSNKNVRFLYNFNRKNFIRNALIFFQSTREASKVILHGNPLLFYFFIFPRTLKKTYWIIYGYEIGHITTGMYNTETKTIHSFIQKFVLKRVFGHITHIKGDSDLANTYFKSSAKFYYSPVYLSNVVGDFNMNIIHPIAQGGVKKILVGNSTSPTNNHASIFEMLTSYKNDNIIIYCPLSYGDYPEYRDNVILMGKNLFGNKFVAMTKFMKLDDYMFFLETIDIAIFNHQRQEAMGVTLQLLRLGKVVYLNRQATSYKSFIERGFKVFDNSLIGQAGLYRGEDVTNNPDLVHTDYSYERLVKSLSDIFDD